MIIHAALMLPTKATPYFSTDRPGFDPGEEIPRIDDLLNRAGFTEDDKGKVCGGNIAELMAI